jgi:hypothetical protein
MVTQMRKLIISLAIVLLTSFPAYANILHIKSESDRPTIERLIAAWYEDAPIYSRHPYIFSGTEIRVNGHLYRLLSDVPVGARMIRIEYDDRTMRIYRLYFNTKEE